jgi:hypothetical protein
MEPAREAPWAEHEKVYLLAEIIKTTLPSHFLFSIIREHNIQPKWTETALPPGRSLRSCQMAYNELSATFPGNDYRPRPHLPAPLLYPGTDVSKKRPHQPEVATPTVMGRLIQPRPPQTYPGELISGPAYTMSPLGEPANKKKRGRPTKAESQARAEAAAARGEVYPTPRKGRPSQTSMVEPSPPGEAPRSGPMQPVPLPMGSTTPQQTQAEEARSEESSGKKKRGKPTPLELDKPQKGMGEMESYTYGQGTGDPSRSQAYSSFTPISAPLRSEESRDRDIRMEGTEDTQPRTTTPHSFKDTVGI